MDSKIYLETGRSYGKTVIKDLYVTAPYKIMSPFYEGGHSDIVQMSSSAGILAGDHLHAEFCFRQDSDLTYLSQSYEKVFDTKDQFASKTVKLTAEQNSRIHYMPYPVIPFQNSDFRSSTEIKIDKTCEFLYSDIFTCGRTGMGEYYRMKCFDSRCRIYVDDMLDYADHTRIEPQAFAYKTLGMWGDYTHNGMLYIHPCERPDADLQELENTRNELKEKLRELIKKETKLLTGITETEHGLLIRTLGYRGDDIVQFHKKLSLVKLSDMR